MSELRPEIVHCYHCGNRHIDDGEFAKKNHSMHRCEHCRRFFYTRSNVGAAQVRLDLQSLVCDGGVAIWAATKPLFDSRKAKHRGPVSGFHVHAYGKDGKVADGTYDIITLDGKAICPNTEDRQ